MYTSWITNDESGVGQAHLRTNTDTCNNKGAYYLGCTSKHDEKGGQALTERIIIGLVALIIGLVLCFAGYRFFRIMIALWGLWIGFLLGSQVTTSYVTGGSSGTLSLLVGIVLGIILALLAYTLYKLAVAILGAGVGYSIGTAIVAYLGYGNQSDAVLIGGIILAVIFALVILYFHLVKLLIMINTALGGASSIVMGLLLLLGVVQVQDLNSGLIGSFIKKSPIWSVTWLVLVVLGILIQAATARNHRVPTTHWPARTAEAS
jgi:Domain of unknown function (DUF4203)